MEKKKSKYAKVVIMCILILCHLGIGLARQLDFYSVLDVPKSSSTKEIKSAYRKLAREYHPDKHPESEKKEFEAKFIELANAYEVLSDEEKRRDYDNGKYNDDSEQFSNFQDAFNRHGMGVEDTPMNWAIVFSVLFMGAFPFAVNYWERLKLKKKKEFLKRQAAIDAVSEKVQFEPTQEELELKKMRLKEKRERKEWKAKKLEEQRAIDLKSAEENLWKVDAPPGAQGEKLRREQALEQLRKNEINGNTRSRGKCAPSTGPWTQKEISLLLKGMKKFPSGTHTRWDRIADLIGTRSPDQTMKQVKHMKAKTTPKLKLTVGTLPSVTAETVLAVKNGKGTEENPWTDVEQAALETGLRTVPKNLDQEARWKKIAAIVSTRTSAECIGRYKHIVAILKARRNSTFAESSAAQG